MTAPNDQIITGRISSRRVFIGSKENETEKEILPERSLAMRNHSPDGFAWGYGGSGPSQLALAILIEVLGDGRSAQDLYQSFKFDIIAALDKDSDFVLPVRDVLYWFDKKVGAK